MDIQFEFGDVLQSKALLDEADGSRPDESIDYSPDRAHMIFGSRNAAMSVFGSCPGVTNERGGCGSAGFADGALSAEACQAICQATRDCKFFTYHVDRPDKRCRLCKDDTRGGKCSSSAERAADPTLHECYWGPKYCRRDDMGTRPDGKRETILSRLEPGH